MMYEFHIALALGLIALSSGVALFVWHDRRHVGASFSKTLGVIVFVIALLSIACTIYCGVMDWLEGDFKSHSSMRQSMPTGTTNSTDTTNQTNTNTPDSPSTMPQKAE